LDIESAQTFSIAAPDYSQLGLTFTTGYNGTDIVVKTISGVEGPFQRKMKQTALPLVGCKLEALDGETIPNYVTSQLVVKAMSRQWSANNRLELTFCDENHRGNVRKYQDSKE
jgi:acyl-coenzyme A synthetase/AMP-(fatty) acid ligase